jgi:L-fucose isomerase
MTDWHPNWDFTEVFLNSMFDWNGDRPPITLATENDGLNGMSMLWGTMMTGLSALFADLRTYWSPEILIEKAGVDISKVAPSGLLHLINSGPAALEWGTDPRLNDPEVRAEMAIKGVEWHPAEKGYFPHDGLSVHFRTPGEVPVTMIRFNRVGLQPTITVIEGHTVDPGNEAAQFIHERTNPTWPDTVVVAEDVDLGEIMINGGGIGNLQRALKRYVSTQAVMEVGIDPNHVACAAGHIGREICLLAAMHRIPVDFTNVVEPWVPTLWQRLGGDREACKQLGPLYA